MQTLKSESLFFIYHKSRPCMHAVTSGEPVISLPYKPLICQAVQLSTPLTMLSACMAHISQSYQHSSHV